MKNFLMNIASRGLFPRFLSAGLALLLFSGDLFAGGANLAWNASTSSNVGGYIVSYGQNSGSYASTVDVGNTTTYAVSGLQDGVTYYFAVKAYDSTGTTQSVNSNEVSFAVPVSTALTADFTQSTTSGPASLAVDFTPITTGTVTSWNWNFSGSYTPTVSIPSPNVVRATYPNPGTYSVSLTATGPSGSSATKTKSNLITVTSPPTVDFTASTTSGPASLVVNFTPITTGTFTSWNWDFSGSNTPTVSKSTPAAVTVTYPNPGTYSVSLTATGSSGSATKTKSNLITVTSTPPVTPPPPISGTGSVGLVAAYGFEEKSGTTVADASGQGNHGTIKEAVRIATGRYGKALMFDGLNDWVTVANSNSLDISTGLTLEAWVYPLSLTTGGKTVILKETSGGAVYNLYANEDANLPISSFYDGSYRVISGPNQLPVNQWTHLVATYDGLYQRLYVNGVEVAKQNENGLISGSTGLLRIGGNSIWGEFFKGYIDDVRIYNRALTGLEVQSNLTTAISVSNPPQFVMGDETLEPWIDYRAQGVAEAFQTVPRKSGVVTSVEVYLDYSSTATKLFAGIYSDKNGHPYQQVAQNSSSTLKSGAWNSIRIAATTVTANKPYWIAIMGSEGEIAFLDQVGSGTGAMETHATSGRTSLPSTWKSSNYKANSSMSVYGKGY